MATIDAVIPALLPHAPVLPVGDYSGMKLLRLSTTTRQRTTWTQGLVLRRILERERSGLPLDASTVYREDANLVTAARRRFDSWESALKAAGVGHARRRIPPRVSAYTRESIIARLREHAATGLPVTSAHPLLRNFGSAVYRLFGTWTSALEAAGIDQPPPAKRAAIYTRESIITLLRDHAAAGLSTETRHPLLHRYERTVRRLFGTWTAALEAAGLPPSVRGRPRRACKPERKSL